MLKCQTDDFDQQTAWKAPVCWLKYTTLEGNEQGFGMLGAFSETIQCPFSDQL